MLTNGILQYPADSIVTTVPQSTVIINNNAYPLLAYADPEHNDINLREYFTD